MNNATVPFDIFIETNQSHNTSFANCKKKKKWLLSCKFKTQFEKGEKTELQFKKFSNSKFQRTKTVSNCSEIFLPQAQKANYSHCKAVATSLVNTNIQKNKK